MSEVYIDGCNVAECEHLWKDIFVELTLIIIISAMVFLVAISVTNTPIATSSNFNVRKWKTKS